MNRAIYARVLFGASAIFFGVIALMWHDRATWQGDSNLWKMPLGAPIGELLMAAQIVAGVALFFPRTARFASIVLAVVYAIFSLAQIPGIVRHATMFGAYDGFFEQFCLLCGAVAVYVVTAPCTARSSALGRGARIGLGLSVISFTLAQALNLGDTAGLVPKWIPPNEMFWAIVTTIAFALAAIAILINVKARLAINLMTLMIVLFGLLVWIPHLGPQPAAHIAWSEFGLTFLIAGASWAVADVPSVS
jgi:hypothetical protein